MGMSKKDFIALADMIKAENAYAKQYKQPLPFQPSTIKTLAVFCRTQNPNFNQDRFLSYIAGECGPSGGAVKK